MTLCVLANSSKWSRTHLVGLGVATATGHVLLSVLLGLGLVGLGLVFTRAISFDVTIVVGGLMLVLGLSYGVRALRSREVGGHQKGAAEGMPRPVKKGRGVTYFAVLGTALSPDLSILPIFLLAVPAGLYLALQTAVVFAVASVLSLVLFVLVGSMGFASLLSRAPAEYNDALAGFVIAAVGAFILLFG
jgi:arginine exporter protein ArgO